MQMSTIEQTDFGILIGLDEFWKMFDFKHPDMFYRHENPTVHNT